jgi:hypothetical protein
MEKKSDNKKSPESIAYELFEKTGKISYYLLYKNLTEE